MLNPRTGAPPVRRAGAAPRAVLGALAVAVVGVLAVAACSSGTATTAANGGAAPTTPTTPVPGSSTAPTAPGSVPRTATIAAKGEVPERFKGYRSEVYADDARWLCKPGIAQDHCRTQELDSTIVRANGTEGPVARKIVEDAPVDCFYVYPTVNLAPGGGNKLDLSQSGVEQAVLRTQGARFTETCNVYAPLYRQMNLSAYAAPEAERKKADDLAYGDVLDAFKQYMANDNKGKPFVLIGHSQGSGHLAHLLQD